jgi:hypothetical protein
MSAPLSEALARWALCTESNVSYVKESITTAPLWEGLQIVPEKEDKAAPRHCSVWVWGSAHCHSLRREAKVVECARESSHLSRFHDLHPQPSHRRKPSHLLHFCPSPRVALSPNHQPDYSLPALRVHQQLPTTPVQRCPALPATLQSLFFLGTSTWFQSSPHGDRIVPQGPAQIPSTFLSVQISWPLLPLKTCPVYACFLVPSPPSNCRLCEGTKQALHRHAAVERLSPPHENAFLVKDIPPWPGLHSSGR